MHNNDFQTRFIFIIAMSNNPDLFSDLVTNYVLIKYAHMYICICMGQGFPAYFSAILFTNVTYFLPLHTIHELQVYESICMCVREREEVNIMS